MEWIGDGRRLRAPALALSVIATFLAALLAPGAASAGPGGLTYVSEGSISPGGVQGSALASCPGDRHVLGGGVKSGGGFDEHHVATTAPFYSGSDPDGQPDDGWIAYADNLTGLGGSELPIRSHAICAKGYVNYKAAGYFAIDPGAERTVALGGCQGQPETHLTGGGVANPLGHNQTHVARTYPNGLWASTVHNVSTHEQHMYPYAICAPGDYTYVTRAKNIGPLKQGRGQARCPGNTHVVGGGANASGDLTQVHLNSSYPRDLGDTDSAPDDAWRVKADDLDPGTRTLTVYAVCKG